MFEGGGDKHRDSSSMITNEEYCHRQSAFLADIPLDNVVLIPTNPVMVRSRDTNFPFRANSYILYLCGWNEPEGLWMAHHNGTKWITSLFVQPRDEKKEIWEGRRIGVEQASTQFPVDEAYSIDDLDEVIKSLLSDSKGINYIQGLNSNLDELVKQSGSKYSDPRPVLDSLRILKSPQEIEVMKKSAEIASQAHINSMKAGHPNVGEWELQSVIESHFVNCKSTWAYPSIVGGGENATILHYKSNNEVINDGELVLIDAGCEVLGYASDITRTWPVNGTFSQPQREIYELVLKAQLAAIEACKVNNHWKSMHEAASIVIAQGLIDLGILQCSLKDALGDNFDGQYRKFFMHGTGHLLGLDVHDVGGGRQGDDSPGPLLQPGMVVTVEPGLYFASWRSDIDVPDRYAGIGIRIEDDILITDDGPVNLSENCPKSIEMIEALVGSGGGNHV
ncbi:MAG: Xaa-Pro aminopeptidase [Thermoplasmata archaeon]|nr:Xaa-Pro aminopeptidase [Thermoplasmata archaeon]